jgi:hypothetical protein
MTGLLRRNFFSKKSVGPAEKQIDTAAEKAREEQQKELEREVAEHLTRWGKPQKDDYDFRNWMYRAKGALLKAGCLYEYARESGRLRGLLVLVNPKRKREPFEIIPLPRIGKAYNLSCSFQNLREEDAGRTLRGAFGWLTRFADELAENKSFAEVHRTKRDEVRRSLGKHRFDLPAPAIQLAIPWLFDYEPPWPWQPWSNNLWDVEVNPRSKRLRLPWRLPDRPGPKDDGEEKIAITIRWRDFRNSEIAEEMKRFAERERPQTEPEPKPQKPEDTIRANLKALSVMRIWKRFPKAKHLRQRIREVARFTDYKGCKDYVVAHRQAFRAGQDDPQTRNARAEMSGACARALSFFQHLFPGETPANFTPTIVRVRRFTREKS